MQGRRTSDTSIQVGRLLGRDVKADDVYRHWERDNGEERGCRQVTKDDRQSGAGVRSRDKCDEDSEPSTAAKYHREGPASDACVGDDISYVVREKDSRDQTGDRERGPDGRRPEAVSLDEVGQADDHGPHEDENFELAERRVGD